MKDNKSIQKQALSLSKKHWKTLVLIYFVCLLPSTTFLLISSAFLQEQRVLTSIISFALNVMMYPVVVLGTIAALLGTWRGKTPSVSMIFQYCNRKSISTALLIGIIYTAVFRLFSIPNTLSSLFQSKSMEALLFMLIGAGFTLVSFWLSLRLILLPYLFCIEFSRKPFELLRESFQRMKGNVGSYIGLAIKVYWWRVLVCAAAIYIFSLVILNSGLFSAIYNNMIIMASLAIGLLIFVVLSPYPSLVLTGFVNSLIPSEKELRKIDKRKDEPK